MTLIENVRIFDGTKFIDASCVSLKDGRINSIYGEKLTDENAPILAPGFIDAHMHGMGGFDCMDENGTCEIAKLEVLHGVTSFAPACVSAKVTQMQCYLESVKQGMLCGEGANVLGAYLEGPFLNAAVKGAHDENTLVDPVIVNYNSLVGDYSDIIFRITMATQREGGLELAKYLIEKGVVVSIGHSTATAEEFLQAIDLGVVTTTHAFNAMKPLHHREPGIIGVTLADDRVWAEFIMDMIHVHPIVLKGAINAKQSKCYFCTDSICAAGMPDGKYKLGTLDVTVEDSVARIANGALAGSTLTMDKGLRNLVNIVGIELPDALRMSSYNVAKAMNISYKGQITAGFDADLVMLDSNLQVVKTYVGGKLVYER